MDQAPADTELRNIIDKLAQFVARNGPEFEQMTKNKQKDNPKFSFLFGGDYFNYYQYKVTTEQAILKQKGINQMQNADPRLNVSQQATVPVNNVGITQNNGLNSMNMGPSCNTAMIGSGPGSHQNTAPNLMTNVHTNSGPGSIPGPPQNSLNRSSGWLQNELSNLQSQQTTLQDQVRQSEQNLAAQHAALMVQQQGRVEDAVRQAQESNLQTNAQSTNTDLATFDTILQPIIDSCTKDSISAGKAWILQHSTTLDSNQVIAEHLLKRVIQETVFNHKLHIIYLVNDVLHHCARKKSLELRKAMESVVVPMFCNASLAGSDEQLNKLNKLLSLWESKNNYFEEGIIDKLKNPNASWTDYQASVMSQHASAITTITATTKQTFDNYQAQHQAFVNHAMRQIQNIEQQKIQIDLQLKAPPPPTPVTLEQPQNVPPLLHPGQLQVPPSVPQHSGHPGHGHDVTIHENRPPPFSGSAREDRVPLQDEKGQNYGGQMQDDRGPLFPQHDDRQGPYGSHDDRGPPFKGHHDDRGPPFKGLHDDRGSMYDDRSSHYDDRGPHYGGRDDRKPPYGMPHEDRGPPPFRGLPHDDRGPFGPPHNERGLYGPQHHDDRGPYGPQHHDDRGGPYGPSRDNYSGGGPLHEDRGHYGGPLQHSPHDGMPYRGGGGGGLHHGGGMPLGSPPHGSTMGHGDYPPHRGGPMPGSPHRPPYPGQHGMSQHGGLPLGGPIPPRDHNMGMGSMPHGGGPDSHVGPHGPINNDSSYNQPPPGWNMPSSGGGGGGGLPPENFPNVSLPDFSKPPPGFGLPPQAPPPLMSQEICLDDLMPSMPYFELPAGLMVPLIKLEDCEYKPLDADAIRLPPPAPPSERLLAAVEAFYAMPNHDSPRDSDGWEKLGLYEYYRAKNAAKKRKDDDIKCGLRQKSRSPSPITRPRSKSPSPPKKRYRSKSRSRSRSRSRDRQQQKSRSRTPPPTPNHRRNSRANHNNRNRRRRNSGKGDQMQQPPPTPDRRLDRSDRSPTPPSFLGSTYSKAVHDTSLDESNKGHQLLRKMGWGGAGLGANEQGIEAPISGGEVRDRNDQYKGVGLNLNDPYENFRKSKGQAFITRMKARAEERGDRSERNDRIKDSDRP